MTARKLIRWNPAQGIFKIYQIVAQIVHGDVVIALFRRRESNVFSSCQGLFVNWFGQTWYLLSVQASGFVERFIPTLRIASGI